MNKKEVERAVRELVASIFEQCHGAYGGNYEGACEREIQELMKAISSENGESQDV